MSEEIEAIADVTTGALVARAVEPNAGEGRRAREIADCLNCGSTLVGEFCHGCGQTAHVHRSFAAIWHGFVHGVLHLDGKIWLTLPLLVRRPGELTRRYIHGERVKFVSPLALFLFSVFLMYGVFSAVGGPFKGSRDSTAISVSTDEAALLKDIAKERDRLEVLRAKAKKAPDDPALAGQIAGAQEALDGMEAGRRAIKGDIDTGNPGLDAKIEQAIKEPGLFAAKLQFNAYKYSWAIILISVPFVWLLFAFRRNYGVYDHAVFVTYSITAMSLLLVLVALLGAIGGIFHGVGQALLVFVPPLHMFAQIRGAYALSTREALWRTAVLLAMVFAVLALFAFLLLTLGFLN